MGFERKYPDATPNWFRDAKGNGNANGNGKRKKNGKGKGKLKVVSTAPNMKRRLSVGQYEVLSETPKGIQTKRDSLDKMEQSVIDKANKSNKKKKKKKNGKGNGKGKK